MTLREPITFVMPVNNEEVYRNNFLASPLVQGDHSHQILAQRNFHSASEAYNAGIDQTESDLIIFTHQDVFFPEFWLKDLEKALSYLEKVDPAWGVLGSYGVTKDNERLGFLYTNGLGLMGTKLERPMSVQTIDEIVLILRKSSGLRFNESLPYFHLYGTDICMEAADKGRRCYAIQAFCIHNTKYVSALPEEFYECYYQIKKRWYKYLPIQASCIRISKADREVYVRKVKRLKIKVLGRDKHLKIRVKDPQEIYNQLKDKYLLSNSD